MNGIQLPQDWFQWMTTQMTVTFGLKATAKCLAQLNKYY